MLKISNIVDFRNHVSHKEEIRESEIGEGCSSFCYMVAAEGTFDDAWSRECRGIVFNTALGTVTGRPLHKFFNVGERAETQVSALDWSRVVRVMDKRDGSMIHSVWTMNGIRLKSKKTFDSDVAKAAEDWMHREEGLNVFRFVSRMVALNKTTIMEWTAPDARIVLFYPDAELRVLHVRDNESGEYMDAEDLRKWASEYNVRLVDEVDEFFDTVEVNEMGCLRKTVFNIDKMLKAAETREGIEGWIVQFDDGNMVKVKTKWYLERHRAMTFLRERDIAEAVLNESLDDLKSLLVSEGVNIDEILKIESKVLEQLRILAHNVNAVVSELKDLSRKDFAIKMNGHPLFGLLMSAYIGKEPDFKGFFVRNVLKEQFSLRQLVLIPSVAEGD